ncbi:MAG: tRNA ligase [Abditibacteriota bacterium]|nr:tRNA ligase [Abditibacteriota bacterium]
MKFFVEKKVLDIGVKIIFPVIYGIDNRSVSGEWLSRREDALKGIAEKYENIDFHEDSIFEGFHILHDRSGVKRRKNVPAGENLIRLLKKHGSMPVINQAVDIYNIISMESKLALGAHDINRTEGNVTLRFTDGTERFAPIGGEAGSAATGEYCYCDDRGDVLCRLEIRQSEKTKVDENSKDIFYIVQGNESVPDELLRDVAERIIAETTKYCGGEGHIRIPEVV